MKYFRKNGMQISLRTVTFNLKMNQEENYQTRGA
jgi:hypothetical protein